MSVSFSVSLSNAYLTTCYAYHSAINTAKSTVIALFQLAARVATYFLSFVRGSRISHHHRVPSAPLPQRIENILLDINFKNPYSTSELYIAYNLDTHTQLKQFLTDFTNHDFLGPRERYGTNPGNYLFVLHFSFNPNEQRNYYPIKQRTLAEPHTLRVPIFFNDAGTVIRDSGFQVPLTTFGEILNSPEARLYGGRNAFRSVTFQAHIVPPPDENGMLPSLFADASPLRVEWIRTVVRGGFRHSL